jgi:hypothetical protein
MVFGKSSFKYEALYNNSFNVGASSLQVRAAVQHLITRSYLFIIILKPKSKLITYNTCMTQVVSFIYNLKILNVQVKKSF